MTVSTIHPKKILVVDDHPIVRQGLRALLATVPDYVICGEAECASAAMGLIDTLQPDLVIVDITLKGADGIELTKSIRARDRNLPILVMSMHDESIYAERSMRAGANGYIMKHEVSDQVINAIQCVLRGDNYASQAVRDRLRQAGGDTEDSVAVRLSDRELEVFRLIGQGVGTRHIAVSLHLSIKTIETYRAHIKEKLGLQDANELMREAVRWMEQQNRSAMS